MDPSNVTQGEQTDSGIGCLRSENVTPFGAVGPGRVR